MQKVIFTAIMFCSMVACTVDYDMKSTNINEQDRIVVNSFLNPAKPIRVYFICLRQVFG
jgi:hypothetical protein